MQEQDAGSYYYIKHESTGIMDEESPTMHAAMADAWILRKLLERMHHHVSCIVNKKKQESSS